MFFRPFIILISLDWSFLTSGEFLQFVMAFLNQLPDEQDFFFFKKALLNDNFSYFRECTTEDLLCAFCTNEN